MEIEVERKVKLRMICFSLALARGLLVSQLRLPSRRAWGTPLWLVRLVVIIRMAHNASCLRFWPAMYVCCLALFFFVETLYVC